jgi:hypothetical protein
LKFHRLTESAANACGFLLAPKSKTPRTGTSPSLRIVRESIPMLASGNTTVLLNSICEMSQMAAWILATYFPARQG